jgi:hypothetical protein
MTAGWPVDCHRCGQPQFAPTAAIAWCLLRDALQLQSRIQVRVRGTIVSRIGHLLHVGEEPAPVRKKQSPVVATRPAQFRQTVQPSVPVPPPAARKADPELQEAVGSWLWQVNNSRGVRA